MIELHYDSDPEMIPFSIESKNIGKVWWNTEWHNLFNESEKYCICEKPNIILTYEEL